MVIYNRDTLILTTEARSIAEVVRRLLITTIPAFFQLPYINDLTNMIGVMRNSISE